MTDDERKKLIHRALTQQDLHRALDGYQEQILAIYDHLRSHYAFNLALERKQYFHALCDIKRAARRLRGESYQEIIDILEVAVDKHFLLNGFI
jgi:hypothetical protein